MAIEDVTVAGSPGWWMLRLANALQAEQKRFALLEQYYCGVVLPPGPETSDRGAYAAIRRAARSNFAALVVEASCERMGLRAISTAAQETDDGDGTAWNLVVANDLDVTIGNAVRMAKKFSRSYLATSLDAAGKPVVTVEDPRLCITEPESTNSRRQRAAFKTWWSAEHGSDVAVLYLPGQKWVATRPRTTPPKRATVLDTVLGAPQPVIPKFSATAYTMMPQRPEDGGDPNELYSETYAEQEIPIDPIENPGGVGDFELHTDVLDRINHGILQRVVIATLQAFRQRAIEQGTEGGLDPEDEQGNPIDYTQVFESAPDALWILPSGAKIWESEQADLQGILSAVKEDLRELAAVTGTPMSMFTPDSANQSAQGASKMDSSLLFKIKDFERSAGRSLSRAVARCFRMTGDAERGDASRVSVKWVDPERYSVQEMASAASMANGSLTWEQKQQIVWQRTPQEIAEAKAQRTQDLMLAAAYAAVPGAQAPGPVPGGAGGGVSA